MTVRFRPRFRTLAAVVLAAALVRRVRRDDEVVELEYRPGPEGPVYAGRR